MTSHVCPPKVVMCGSVTLLQMMRGAGGGGGGGEGGGLGGGGDGGGEHGLASWQLAAATLSPPRAQ